MQTTIGNCIRQAARICGEKEIPNRIVSAFFDIILAYTKRRDYEVKPSLHTSIKRAIHAQQQVGITLFCRGFIAREWGAAMKATKTKFPQWKIEILLTTVWDTIFEPLWTCRNNILHKQSNFRTVADDSELSRKLTWFSTHQNSVLAYHLRHFADITPDDLRQWSRPTKRARVLLLEAAQRRLIIQRKQQLKHQRVLSEFFQPTLTLE
jgi:hypothetical protein